MQFLIKLNPPIRQPAQPRSPLVNCFCMCDYSWVVLISHTLLWTVIYFTPEIKFLLEPNMRHYSTMELNIPTVTLFLHWLFILEQEQSLVKSRLRELKHWYPYTKAPSWNQSSTEAGTGIPCRLLKTLKWKNTRYWHGNNCGICCKCCFFSSCVRFDQWEGKRTARLYQDRLRGARVSNRLCIATWFQQHCPAKALGIGWPCHSNTTIITYFAKHQGQMTDTESRKGQRKNSEEIRELKHPTQNEFRMVRTEEAQWILLHLSETPKRFQHQAHFLYTGKTEELDQSEINKQHSKSAGLDGTSFSTQQAVMQKCRSAG